ncbi:MAG: phosphatidate cytidylyltransferase [Flavobacteriaceae bacterium]
MKEITTRAISGSLYVALLTTTMFTAPLAFYILIAVFAGLALWEFQRLIDFNNVVGPLLLIGMYALAFFELYPALILDLLLYTALLVNVLITFICLSNRQPSFSSLSKIGLILFYLIGSSLFIPLLIRLNKGEAPLNLLFFYVAIWLNNSFAYLVGSRIGKTKLLPSISPKKSWEGYIGGALATLLLLFIVEHYLSLFNGMWWVVGLLLPALATLGDFVQSYFKRRANVKDSGTLLPGHGGFYDRMDSVIYTAPFYYLLLKFI